MGAAMQIQDDENSGWFALETEGARVFLAQGVPTMLHIIGDRSEAELAIALVPVRFEVYDATKGKHCVTTIGCKRVADGWIVELALRRGVQTQQ